MAMVAYDDEGRENSTCRAWNLPSGNQSKTVVLVACNITSQYTMKIVQYYYAEVPGLGTMGSPTGHIPDLG